MQLPTRNPKCFLLEDPSARIGREVGAETSATHGKYAVSQANDTIKASEKRTWAGLWPASNIQFFYFEALWKLYSSLRRSVCTKKREWERSDD
jgi:hypothetical protein